MILEVCVDSVESVLNAIHGGADELELCCSIPDGGLTPSVGFVRHAITVLDNYTENSDRQRPKINVLLRPRAGADFHYSELDIQTMMEDIAVFQTLSVDRFVFGCLTETGFIDDNCNRILLEAAYPTPCTFHRAYDVSKEDPNALELLKQLGFDRVLTSGKCEDVGQGTAAEHIQSLLRNTNGDINIVPGGGVTFETARKYLEMGCTILHSTCKSPIYKPKINPCLGFGVDGIFVTDLHKVQKLRKLLSEFEPGINSISTHNSS